MRKRKSTDKRICNYILVIALILGASMMVAVSATEVRAQDQGTQTTQMPYDLHFIDMMRMHHRQGIAMGRVAEKKGSTLSIRAFAKRTADGQEKELLKLKQHRDHWYPGAAEMDHSHMMTQMHQTPGMSGHANMKMDMQGDIAKLQAAAGKTFDRLFLDMMIPHHQMAIDMSKEAVTKAEHAELKEMARLGMIEQQKEIAEMKKLKGGSVARAKPKPKVKAKPKTSNTHVH